MANNIGPMYGPTSARYLENVEFNRWLLKYFLTNRYLSEGFLFYKGPLKCITPSFRHLVFYSRFFFIPVSES